MTTFNKIFYQLAVILMLSQISCVQKSFERMVKVTLDVSQIPNIKTVGVRGEGKPLSWDEDLAMKVVPVISMLYRLSGTTTGYKFLEIKYVVNGEFELQDQPNRRIYFDENSPVTIANHTFNNIK